ncbi:MAG: Iron complex outerrane recepter protein [Verrucomicrobia bacterium]|nr:Iron complex outerrane recepter protein [Verrucomicrobiota bacterium]
MKILFCKAAGLFGGIALAVAGLVAAEPAEPNLGDLSIEQLMNESVTSVAKKEQRLFDAAAAISVLSNDELRRSGATTIADALRLIPGMDVGLIDANQWAISARGFQGLYANKLLVLIDGRAVYNPLFGGVFWDVQQVFFEDVDRIEVIRGPGATVWGSNAVNGVINVVSKSARETQGGYVYGAAGDVHQVQSGLRYGGTAGEHGFYRVYADYHSIDDFPTASGGQGGDNWSAWQSGARVDHYPDDATHVTGQADFTRVRLEEGKSSAYNANALGRWTHAMPGGSNLEVTTYFDRSVLDEASRVHAVGDVFDATLQHTLAAGGRQEFIWGVGYRNETTTVRPTNAFIALINDRARAQIFSAFVQDEIKLISDRLRLTVGSKFEHNDFTGWEIQPSVRATFKLSPSQAVWAAVSRAVRTPSDFEHEKLFAVTGAPIFVGPVPYFTTLYGNPAARSENLLAYEAGYRAQVSRHVSVDAALFYNQYRDLLAAQLTGRLFPDTGPFPGTGRAEQLVTNSQSAETYGGEFTITVAPSDRLRLTVSYSRLAIQAHSASVLDAETLERSSPSQQAALRCNYDFTKRTSVDFDVRHVGSVLLVPAYTTADLRLSFRLTDRIEGVLVGRNLLQPHHPEQPPAPGPVLPITEVPRNFYAKLSWRF